MFHIKNVFPHVLGRNPIQEKLETHEQGSRFQLYSYLVDSQRDIEPKTIERRCVGWLTRPKTQVLGAWWWGSCRSSDGELIDGGGVDGGAAVELWWRPQLLGG